MQPRHPNNPHPSTSGTTHLILTSTPISFHFLRYSPICHSQFFFFHPDFQTTFYFLTKGVSPLQQSPLVRSKPQTMSPLLLARRRNPREDSGYGACPCPGAHCTFARLPNTPTNTPKLQKFASVTLLALIRARITSTNVDARSWAHLKSCPCPWRSGPEPGTCSSAGGICSHLPGEWEMGEGRAQGELW